MHLPPAAVGTGQGQHILDQLPHAASLPGDDLGEGFPVRPFRPFHGGGGREDGRQRRAQLMGGSGNKPGLPLSALCHRTQHPAREAPGKGAQQPHRHGGTQANTQSLAYKPLLQILQGPQQRQLQGAVPFRNFGYRRKIIRAVLCRHGKDA